MKKLISLLMVLLMVFTGVIALAETTEDAPAQTPEVGAEVTDNEAPAEDGAANTAEENGDSELSAQPLMTKGLIVTAGGLCGVFLVLILFFLMIKIMGKFMK